MGSCVSKEFLAKARKEHPVAAQLDCAPAAPPETQDPALAPDKDVREQRFEASSGIFSGTNPGAYRVTALATSSLVGLVQTVKEHVTKPTAMARGRVAHLIEWKGWSAPRTGWEPSLRDEEGYAELADELKAARFAAGVAEQFAITEATLSAWSSLDEADLTEVGGSLDAIQLQDLGDIYLQENLLLSPHAVSGLPAAERLPAFSPSSRASPVPDGHWTANGWSTLIDRKGGPGSTPSAIWQPRSTTSLRYVDSSSLSEDDVFYN